MSHTGARVTSVATPIISMTNTATANDRYIAHSAPFDASSVEFEKIYQSPSGKMRARVG